MRKFAAVLFLILFIFPSYKAEAQASNPGFLSSNISNIWYSKDPFEEGDKIKIYTVIFNPDSRELSGTIAFFDINAFLGKIDFVVPPKEVKSFSIDWTATAGNHTIFGKIEKSKFLISSGKYEEIYLSGNETEKSVRSVAKKIIPKASDPVVSAKGTADTKQNPITAVKNIETLIKEKTPDVIAKPIVATASAIEGFRESTGAAAQSKKEEVKNEIKNLGETVAKIPAKTADKSPDKISSDVKVSSDPKIVENSKALKPFKYVELFFLTLASAVLNNWLLFYGISAALLFFVVRYIWRLFF